MKFNNKLLAEEEGFEPPEPYSSMVFKTIRLNHSRTHPVFVYIKNNYFSLYFYILKSGTGWIRTTIPGFSVRCDLTICATVPFI